MPKRLLIVDDEPYFRSLLRDTLKGEDFEIAEAENGRQGRDRIALETFDVVISDIRMPKMNGIELLHWTRANFPKLPMILVTGFSEIMETREAAEIGAKWFLSKPFLREELISALEQALQEPNKALEAEEDLDGEYCKISIDDFVSGSQIEHDIFIRISKSRYVKVAHNGQDISIDRIRSYKSKDIRHLYLQKDDFRKYVGLSLQIAQSIPRARNLEKSKKINFLKHTGELVLDQVYSRDVNAAAFDSAKTLVTSTIDVIADDDDVANLIGLMSSHSDYLYAHCVGVSFISVLLARGMGWRAPSTLFKVSYGGLLHDIGLKEISRDIWEKPRTRRTSDEVASYESHPIRGMEILRDIPGMLPEVIQIVQQHHENCVGLGYPLRLKRVKINPLARLVAVADEFCSLTIKPRGEEGLRPYEAFNRINTVLSDRLDPEMLKSLGSLFAKEPK